MRLTIDAACVEAMKNHAERTYPEECCGAMIGSDLADGAREVVATYPIGNTEGKSRTRRYIIDSGGQLAAEREAHRRGRDVVGIYHSHPNHPSAASEVDRQHAMPFWSYLIVSCMHGTSASVQSWRLRDDRSVFDEEVLTVRQ